MYKKQDECLWKFLLLLRTTFIISPHSSGTSKESTSTLLNPMTLHKQHHCFKIVCNIFAKDDEEDDEC